MVHPWEINLLKISISLLPLTSLSIFSHIHWNNGIMPVISYLTGNSQVI